MPEDNIILEPYDPKWLKKANDEIQLLQMALPLEVTGSIQHIGSTAIHGMPAKPIIDLMMIVQDINATDALIPLIEALGYVYWRDNPKKDHLFFVKGLPKAGGAGRTHHLHIFQKNSYEYFARSLFRDYLISHPDKKSAYVALKTKLALKYIDDRETYTSKKTDFVNQVSQEAMLPLMQFIPLSAAYFNILHRWFNQPHVQEFYSCRSWTFAEVERKLTSYLELSSSVKGYMVLLDSTPIAYLQYCNLASHPWPDQDLSETVIQRAAGLDFFIGELDFIGKGFGGKIVDIFMEQLIWPTYDTCLVDPDICNQRSIKMFEKCGFTRHKKIVTENALGKSVTLQLMIKSKQE